MSFLAGSAVGFLDLDTSGFEGGILRSNALMAVFPQAVTNFLASPMLGVIGIAEAMGQAIVDGVQAGLAKVGEVAGKFDDMGEAAQKAGVSVEFLSQVGAAAADAGSSVEGLQDSLKFLANNAADAADGGEVGKSFQAIGVSVTDAGGKLKDNEALFYEMADAIKAIDDPARRTQAAMNLLGRGGVDMLALLAGGAAGLDEAAASFTRYSGGVSQAEAALGDSFQSLLGKAGDFMTGLGEAFAVPVLQFFADHQGEILELMNALAPAAQAAAEAVGGFLADGLSAALDVAKALLPVLEAVAATIRVVAQLGSGGLGLLGLGSGAAGAAYAAPAGRTGLPAGGFGGNSAGAGGGGLSVGEINLTLDPNATSDQLARRLAPELRAGFAGFRGAVSSGRVLDQVKEGM